MTKIDIISGFLGAGKTTFIKKLLEEAIAGEKVVLIENEFGEIGIDGGFLKDSGIEIREMNSGCICCSLVGDFGTSLAEVLTKYKPERIIIEPSGVGKLSDVMKAVVDVSADMDVELNSAVTIVDAAKCKRAGISPGAVLDALGSYCGGAYISNYNQFGKVYRVMMQASPEYRLDEQALGNMFVRNGTEMAPVSQFVTLNKVLGPETANRFNLYSAIAANVNPAEGYSSGEVQKVIAEVAEQTLPLGYGYEYGGMAREEANTGGAQTVFIYAICIFLIYLILACLYESFLIPFAVIFSVPFGLMGSFLFAKVLGLENNIYLQTGVIMLIGLLAKTAILITEYAIERRRKGMGIVESAYSAAQVRLRPILMTVLTMIFGMLPLMFSSGAGANGNSSLGTGVVGGMLIGTLALLFVVPVFYIIFEYLQEKVRPPMEEEADMQVLLEKQKSEAERAKD